MPIAVIVLAVAGCSNDPVAPEGDTQPIADEVPTTAEAVAVDAAVGEDAPTAPRLITAWIDAQPRLAEIYDRKIQLSVIDAGDSASGTFDSPTLTAMQGLVRLHVGDLSGARAAADELLRNSARREDALWFPFQWDYQAVWPYTLEAPWVSALTQGLALSLFDQLADVDPDQTANADAIARSLLLEVPDGGLVRVHPDGSTFIEEYPLEVPTYVLNGGLVALLSLIDYIDGDPEAADAFRTLRDQTVAWLEQNLHRYTYVDDSFAVPIEVSAYSLAPRRTEVLFRFVGPGAAVVDRITIRSDGNEPTILDVGTPGDADKSADIYLWDQLEFQNWTARDETRSTRSIKPRSGTYDHAPFSVALEPAQLVQDWTIEVGATVSSPGKSIDLQVFDGEQYHHVGTLVDDQGATPTLFPIPSAALEVIADTPQRPALEPSYFVDNLVLAGLLTDRYPDLELGATIAGWADSLLVVPPELDARETDPLDTSRASDPVVPIQPGAESIHVEYPSVLEFEDEALMLYSAYGDDRRWRLMIAESTDDGVTWHDRRPLFTDQESGATNAAFPDVIRDDATGEYVLTFSADLDGDARYDSIMTTRGPDPRSFPPPRAAADVGGLDPTLWFEDGQLYLAYALSGDEGTTTLREHEVAADLSLRAERVLLSSEPLGRVFYTTERIEIGDRVMWIVDGSLDQRLSWWIYCVDPTTRSLIRSASPEIRFTDRTVDTWDEHRYGLEILTGSDELVVYYNGIDLGNGEGNGMIGRATIDPNALIEQAGC